MSFFSSPSASCLCVSSLFGEKYLSLFIQESNLMLTEHAEEMIKTLNMIKKKHAFFNRNSSEKV